MHHWCRPMATRDIRTPPQRINGPEPIRVRRSTTGPRHVRCEIQHHPTIQPNHPLPKLGDLAGSSKGPETADIPVQRCTVTADVPPFTHSKHAPDDDFDGECDAGSDVVECWAEEGDGGADYDAGCRCACCVRGNVSGGVSASRWWLGGS